MVGGHGGLSGPRQPLRASNTRSPAAAVAPAPSVRIERAISTAETPSPASRTRRSLRIIAPVMSFSLSEEFENVRLWRSDLVAKAEISRSSGSSSRRIDPLATSDEVACAPCAQPVIGVIDILG